MRFEEEHLAIGDGTVRLAFAREFTGNAEDRYWASLWPSAVALAEQVAVRGEWEGIRVLELGCGCGLAGIAAGLRGAAVTVTDLIPDALRLAEANWRRNGITPAGVERLDWRGPPGDRAYDRVLAADVLYNPDDFSSLLHTLRSCLAPGGTLWIAEPGRPAAHAFFARLLGAGFRIHTAHRRVELHGETFEISVNECG